MQDSNNNKYGNASINQQDKTSINTHNKISINAHKHAHANNTNTNANAYANNTNTSINTNATTNSIQKQAGYTLVELGLVLIIILILGGVIYASFTAIYNSAKDQQVEKEVLQFNLALHRCLDRDPTSLSSCNGAKIQLYSGLTSTTTACGDSWSAIPTADNVAFTYPLARCDDSDGLGSSLENKINELPNVSAVYTAATKELVVTGVR